jgi:Asp-tRNA(Asn)/Glu-tRNA(Gln) amidotransferase A subunit family amidase
MGERLTGIDNFGAIVVPAPATVRHSMVGVLRGVRFTVKAARANGTLPSTAGSLLIEDRRRRAAPVVTRLLNAGAEFVGVTNCAEFALAPVAESPRYGRTRNPVTPDRTAGGSSCGCAAAVAAGFVSVGVGTDDGGSVRFPAFCTGTLGFRPARRSVPTAGQVPTPPPATPRARFSTPGVITRAVKRCPDRPRRLERSSSPANQNRDCALTRQSQLAPEGFLVHSPQVPP